MAERVFGCAERRGVIPARASCGRRDTKPGPYFGNWVLMDVYSLEGERKEEAAALPVAGTYKRGARLILPIRQTRLIYARSTIQNWS